MNKATIEVGMQLHGGFDDRRPSLDVMTCHTGETCRKPCGHRLWPQQFGCGWKRPAVGDKGEVYHWNTIGYIWLYDMHMVRTSKAKPALQQKRLPRVPKSKHKSEAAARSLKVFSSRLPLVGSPNAFGNFGYKIQNYLFIFSCVTMSHDQVTCHFIICDDLCHLNLRSEPPILGWYNLNKF